MCRTARHWSDRAHDAGRGGRAESHTHFSSDHGSFLNSGGKSDLSTSFFFVSFGMFQRTNGEKRERERERERRMVSGLACRGSLGLKFSEARSSPCGARVWSSAPQGRRLFARLHLTSRPCLRTRRFLCAPGLRGAPEAELPRFSRRRRPPSDLVTPGTTPAKRRVHPQLAACAMIEVALYPVPVPARSITSFTLHFGQVVHSNLPWQEC